MKTILLLAVIQVLVVGRTVVLFGAEAAKEEEFKPDALVILSNGTRVELADFSFFDNHRRSDIFVRGRSVSESDLPLKQGDFWRLLPVSEIKTLDCARDGENPRWLSCKATLVSANEAATGKLPVYCEDTWMDGNGFELAGKTKLLGTEADYTLPLESLVSLRRVEEKPGVFSVTDKDGKRRDVTKLVFRRWHEGDVSSGGPPTATKSPIQIKVEESQVELTPAKIDELVFDVKGTIRVKMLDGETAEGQLSEKNRRVYGKLKDRLVLFGPVSLLRSVKYLHGATAERSSLRGESQASLAGEDSSKDTTVVVAQLEKARQQTSEAAARTDSIPEQFRILAQKTFAEGKPLFIWDAGGPSPIEFASTSIGARSIGYAISPKAARIPSFSFRASTGTENPADAGRVNDDRSGGKVFAFLHEKLVEGNFKLNRTSVVYAGPRAPERVGVADVAVFTPMTADELGKLIHVQGPGNADIVVVPEGTQSNTEDFNPLSNRIVVPVKAK